uniref:Uncharacterized protein n=1 Tax=Romanomermis culicivorax TaxID=13658 RepID=A0A915KQ83_ROMCU
MLHQEQGLKTPSFSALSAEGNEYTTYIYLRRTRTNSVRIISAIQIMHKQQIKSSKSQTSSGHI